MTVQWYRVAINGHQVYSPLTPDQVTRLSTTHTVTPAEQPADLADRLATLLVNLTRGSEAVTPLYVPAQAGRTPTPLDVEPVTPWGDPLGRTPTPAGLARTDRPSLAGPVNPAGEAEGTGANTHGRGTERGSSSALGLASRRDDPAVSPFSLGMPGPMRPSISRTPAPATITPEVQRD